jgi:phosphoglucosamine mutase
VNVRVKSKPPLEDLKNVGKKIKDAEKDLGDSGLILVRYSGTESICRVTVQGSKQKQVSQLAEDIATAIKEEIGI